MDLAKTVFVVPFEKNLTGLHTILCHYKNREVIMGYEGFPTYSLVGVLTHVWVGKQNTIYVEIVQRSGGHTTGQRLTRQLSANAVIIPNNNDTPFINPKEVFRRFCKNGHMSYNWDLTATPSNMLQKIIK